MAKDRKKLLHIHSSIPDKQPTAASLEVGEIAVNNSKDQEFLSVKNSDNKVVRFSSDEQIVTIMEKKEVIPYSGSVDNVHLDTNRSNIEIKLNQVVAENTVKHDVVNGAKDIDGNLVNPTTDGGLTNGAGFAIDMSQYAMIGANPSFSGVTTTCYTNLNGTTTIKGTNGTCGSLLDIDVATENGKITTATNTIGTATTNVTAATTTIGTATTNVTSANTTIGTDILHVTGTTTETHDGTVTITNNTGKTETTNGANTVNNNNNYTVNTTGVTTMSSTGNTCINSQADAAFYGKNNTNIGKSCDGSVTTTATVQSTGITNIYGPTTNISGTTVNVTGTTNIKGDTNITGNTYISGPITIGTQCTGLTSSTIHESFCETLSRSKVTIEENHDPSDTSLAAIYTFYQNGQKLTNSAGTVVEIEVPKDKVLKSAEVVQNTSGEWVIRLTWLTYDPDTGTSTETTTDIPASELVKDLDAVDTPAINLDIWYDAASGNQKISADTTIKIVSPNGDKTFSKSNAVHSLNSYQLSTASGAYSATSNTTFDPLNANASINIPTDASHIANRSVSWTYGDVKSATGSSYVPSQANNGSFVIPQCAGDINRATLDYKYGQSVTGRSDGNYDPGEACNNAASDTIYIPTSIDHLEEWNGTCFTIPHNLCVDGTITASQSIYSTSDERKKENIHFIQAKEASTTRKIPFKSFNLISDPERKVYGVIAQEVLAAGLDNLVHMDEEGYYSVDYTSLLILKIENLQNEVGELYEKIKNLEDKLNKKD